jgi:hypothetical protein
VSIYALVAIARKRWPWKPVFTRLYNLLVSVTLFEKTPILQALQTFDMETNLIADANQLILFNL